jgi:hypothetical protein
VGRDLEDFQRTYVAGTRENQELSLHFRDAETLREALSTYLSKSSSWEVTKGNITGSREGADRDLDGLAEGQKAMERQEREVSRQRQVMELER